MSVLRNKAKVVVETLAKRGYLEANMSQTSKGILVEMVLKELKMGGNHQLLEGDGQIHVKAIVRGDDGKIIGLQG